MRRFSVFDKRTSTQYEVSGVDELATLIGCSVKEIPKVRLFKYTVGTHQVTERKN